MCVTVPLKGKLPPSRETRLVSCETRLERNETSLVRNETSLVSRECTGSTNATHSLVFETCFVNKTSVSYRIVSISAVDTIFILISNACVPCVYYKFSSVQYCFIYIDQTFFYSSQTCLTFSFCKYMHDKSWRYMYVNRRQVSHYVYKYVLQLY